MKDKTDRIEQLAGEIAKQIGADEVKAKRAGLLSKCDLMTNMVFEFTDTQGVMGMHYARHDGEDEEVAVAIKRTIYATFRGDELPKSLVASAVALADKFDTLTGSSALTKHPKAVADPFALSCGIRCVTYYRREKLTTGFRRFSEKISRTFR